MSFGERLSNTICFRSSRKSGPCGADVERVQMADKQEIFDYLRNRQKAAEIEAKVNGINLWVLFGAMAVVTWQLLGSIGGDFLNNPELILRTLLCTEAIYMFSFLGETARRTREDIRYSHWGPADIESPFLILLQGTLLLLPPLLSLVLIGRSWSSAILGIFGLIFVGLSVAAIGSRLLQVEGRTEKFPKPTFELTTRADAVGNIVMGIALSLAALEQGMFARDHHEMFTIELARQLTLLAALYLLFMVTVQRKHRSNSTAWTYELETELLLDAVSAEVAARRIEHRGLGRRLQDVMDRFFDDMDARFIELDSLFDQSRSQLDSAKEVPAEYGAERAARTKEATRHLSVHIDTLTRDCDEFRNYLKKIAEKNLATEKSILAPHLISLNARHATYAERLRRAETELKNLMS